MLRSRRLRPGFFGSYDIGLLQYSSRLLFSGLWCMADRSGRLLDKPGNIRGLLFPYDPELNVDEGLEELQDHSLIVRYTGKVEDNPEMPLIWIRNFGKYQTPAPSEAKSHLPACPEQHGAFINGIWCEEGSQNLPPEERNDYNPYVVSCSVPCPASSPADDAPKRRRGRPRKHPLPPADAPKRPVGRPRKYPPAPADAPKRPVGRPRKTHVQEPGTEAAKRPVGRPRKHPLPEKTQPGQAIPVARPEAEETPCGQADADMREDDRLWAEMGEPSDGETEALLQEETAKPDDDPMEKRDGRKKAAPGRQTVPAQHRPYVSEEDMEEERDAVRKASAAKPLPPELGFRRPRPYDSTETGFAQFEMRNPGMGEEWRRFAAFYDKECRPAGKFEGWPQFQKLVLAGDWPGTDEVVGACQKLMAPGRQWGDRKFIPGRRRFLEGQMWTMRPEETRSAPAGHGGRKPGFDADETKRMLEKIVQEEAGKGPCSLFGNDGREVIDVNVEEPTPVGNCETKIHGGNFHDEE